MTFEPVTKRASQGKLLHRNLSVFLDLLRLLAASLVLIGHAGAVFRLAMPDIAAHSAKDGVAIFFVLSGFVIAFVATCKETDWRSFALARALRMYSVIPLAIVVLVACHVIGRRINPGFYDGSGASGVLGGALVGVDPEGAAVLRYLTFTNELWFDRVVISTGAPFWSLSFEAAYYVAFAILFYGRGTWRWIMLLLWVSVCGPHIAFAFPLWLLGVAAWRLVQWMPRIGSRAGWALSCGLALSAFAWRKWAGAFAAPLFEWPATGPLVASAVYYLVLGALVAAMIVVFAACTSGPLIWPRGLERAIRYCAGASFTVYIAHLPIMVLIAAIWPGVIGSFPGGGLAAATSVMVTFILAELGERRKATYVRTFRFLVRMGGRLKNAAILLIY